MVVCSHYHPAADRLLRSETDRFYGLNIQELLRGLLGLVLLFDIYSVYQQVQIHRIRRHLMSRDDMFRVISENADDMIAVVDTNGKRIYNSSAYERLLGYTAQELWTTSALEQIHTDDRARVAHAAEQARKSGRGSRRAAFGNNRLATPSRHNPHARSAD
jgi:PAS domain-containing protein